eukprot:scaffold1982_cov93-Amphora_coffeaeformis.AAC.21
MKISLVETVSIKLHNHKRPTRVDGNNRFTVDLPLALIIVSPTWVAASLILVPTLALALASGLGLALREGTGLALREGIELAFLSDRLGLESPNGLASPDGLAPREARALGGNPRR